ncbi:hypothetical protein J7E49_13765 [Variovorax paradoxus]|nr:hypothetical protein [Variovorax paradoxus]
MPMLELSYTRGAMSPEQIKTLLHRATKVLMWWEKIPDTPQARKIAWTLAVEQPAEYMLVGGLPTERPRYRFVATTIEGLMDDRAKQGVMRDLTRLALEIEGAPLDAANAARVWCLLREVPRNCWGIGGVPFAPSGYLSALDEIRFEGDKPIE